MFKTNNKKRLRERTWFMWFMLMVFFPVGIYLAWKYHPLGKKVIKYFVATVLGVAILSVGITSCFGKDEDKKENNTSTFSITRVERNETSIPDEELTVVDSNTNSGTWFDFPASEELANYTGLYETDYGWAYLKNGIIDTSYFGLASKEDGTYFVANGFIDWDKGVIPVGEPTGAWFDYPGKEGLENYNGLYETDYGWAYLKNGVIDTDYNGYAANAVGIYFVSNGFIDWSKAVKKLGTTTTSTTKKTTTKKTTTKKTTKRTTTATTTRQSRTTNRYSKSRYSDPRHSTTTVATTRQQLPWYDYPAYPQLAGYTGLYKTDDGRWAYLNNGVIDVNYNDWAENEYGGYTVVNGFVDWSKPHYSKTTTTKYYTTARKSSGGNSGSSSGYRSPSTARVTEAPNNDSSLVWIPTNGGKKYHSYSGCSGMKNPRQVSRSKAVQMGYSACSKC